MPSRRQVLAGLGSAAVPALTGCLDDALSVSPGTDSNTDWPMARYDSTNTAYNPDAKAPRDDVQERWTYEESSATGTPVIVNGRVVLPTVEALVALDAADGTEQWRFSPSKHPWPSAPAVHNGMVFVTMIDEDTVYALDAASGEELWSRAESGHIHAAPHLVAGEHVSETMLYSGTESGELLRIDPSSGAVTWQTDLFGGITAVGFRLPQLYVGTTGGEVYAYGDWGDADEPLREAWRRKVGSKVESLLPTTGGVLVHTFADPLVCLQDGAHAGTTRWSVDEKWANSAPVHANYTAFAAGYDGLSALREHDGKFRWQLRGRYDSTDPVAAGDTLYVSSGTAVHAFALDGGTGIEGYRFGAKRWSHPTPPGAVEGLAVADGAVFAACEGSQTDDTTLYCLESA